MSARSQPTYQVTQISGIGGMIPFPEELEAQGIRLMRPDELNSVFEAHQEVWGGEVTRPLERRWEWLQHRNPYRTDGEIIVPLAIVKGAIDAFHVLLPHTFRAYGKPWRVYMGGHLTGRKSAPSAAVRLNVAMFRWPAARWGLVSYTGRTILRFMRRYDYFKAPDKDFEPERAEELSDEQKLRCGLFHWDWKPALVRPLRLEPYLPSRWLGAPGSLALSWVDRAWLRRSDDPRVIEVAEFPDAYDPWLEDAMAQYPVVQERTVRYLNWRYVEFPDVRYRRFLFEDRSGEPVGYAVIEEASGPRQNPIWAVADLFVRKGDQGGLAGVLRALLREARRAGATAVRARDTGDPALLPIYRGLGFRPRGEDDRKLMLFRSPLNVELSTVADRASWPVSPGDGDARVI